MSWDHPYRVDARPFQGWPITDVASFCTRLNAVRYARAFLARERRSLPDLRVWVVGPAVAQPARITI